MAVAAGRLRRVIADCSMAYVCISLEWMKWFPYGGVAGCGHNRWLSHAGTVYLSGWNANGACVRERFVCLFSFCAWLLLPAVRAMTVASPGY